MPGSSHFGHGSLSGLASLDFFDRVLALVSTEAIEPLKQLAKTCGWWWAFRDVMVLTERPTRLFRDELGRLHNENGAAIEYPDGWSVSAWHHRLLCSASGVLSTGSPVSQPTACSRSCGTRREPEPVSALLPVRTSPLRAPPAAG